MFSFFDRLPKDEKSLAPGAETEATLKKFKAARDSALLLLDNNDRDKLGDAIQSFITAMLKDPGTAAMLSPGTLQQAKVNELVTLYKKGFSDVYQGLRAMAHQDGGMYYNAALMKLFFCNKDAELRVKMADYQCGDYYYKGDTIATKNGF